MTEEQHEYVLKLERALMSAANFLAEYSDGGYIEWLELHGDVVRPLLDQPEQPAA